MSIKVTITDDHPLAISGVKTMLVTAYPDIEITHSYNSGTALLEGLKQQKPDILLLDIMLPDISGKELAPTIRKEYPDVKIIALTSLDAPATIHNMMQQGCLGYLLKDTDQKTLIEAIKQVYKGEEFIEASLREHLVQYMLKNLKNNPDQLVLTPREKEILKMIAEEFTTQEIADKLFISLRTAETHRYTLLQKMGVKNTAGLVKMAMKLGLVE